MEILADDAISKLPDSLVRGPACEWRAAQGFCRFPWIGLDRSGTTVGESRFPLLGVSNGVSLESS
jgi:hypothetical protein